MELLAIAPAGRSEAYRFRDERGKVVHHSSVPTNDEAAYAEAVWLAEKFDLQTVYIERRVYVSYPWRVKWVNLLFYWDNVVGDLAA